VTDREIDFSNTSDVAIELTGPAAAVAGSVAVSPGDGAKNVTIVLFADATQLRFQGSRFTRTAKPDKEGRFAIAGLAPGTYILSTVEDYEFGSEGDPLFLAALATSGERVKLLGGKTETILVRPPSR